MFTSDFVLDVITLRSTNFVQYEKTKTKITLKSYLNNLYRYLRSTLYVFYQGRIYEYI